MRPVRVVAIIMLACGGGCSFLFDPEGLAPQAASPDLAAPVEDLLAPADLTIPEDLAMPDLAPEDAAPDLLLPPDQQEPPDLLCVPPVFPGFTGDGGAVEPFDCRRCGCAIDSFTNYPGSLDTHWNHTPNSGTWTTTMSGGTMILRNPNPPNELDQFTAANKFYLDGDFDVRIDYQIDAWAPGANLRLIAFGPTINDAGTIEPIMGTITYLGGDGPHTYLFLDYGVAADSVSGVTGGTLELRRSGATLCGTLGDKQFCKSGSSTARIYLILDAVVNNTSCSPACDLGSCCTFQARLTNLRLRTGSIVRTP